jgi:hypothetical protein
MTLPSHIPHRGSDVEAWLKRHRDEYAADSDDWRALDVALDDYRLAADLGRDLADVPDVSDERSQ